MKRSACHSDAMPDQKCLIIDDIQSALSRMTELGREVVGPSAAAIRDAVANYALRRSWVVLGHRGYVDWASAIIKDDGRAWLVLDPLFPIDALGSRVQRVRLTRVFDDNEAVVRRKYVRGAHSELFDAARVTEEVGLVDDAAGSGRTIRYMQGAVSQVGARITHIAVAASSRGAQESVRTAVGSPQWSQYLRGDWRVIHLRDGCPYLPYSGRPTGQAPIPCVEGGEIEVRVSAAEVVGSLWGVLVMDATIHAAVAAAPHDIAQRLGAALQREALISDLHLLGSTVSARQRFGTDLTSDATLEFVVSK